MYLATLSTVQRTVSRHNEPVRQRFLFLAEYFRRDLEVAGLSKALDDLTTHENENVKKRAVIILTRIKAHKLAQQE